MKLGELEKIAKRRRLDFLLVADPANIRCFTGVNCDSAVLQTFRDSRTFFHTDFRYVPMVHRVAPELKVRDIRKLGKAASCRRAARLTISVTLSTPLLTAST